MSTMKPDYFIAQNGLPNILVARSRHVITQAVKNSCDRVLGNQQQQIHPQTKNKRFIGCGLNQQAMHNDSEKNLRNRAIKESLRKSKSTKDLINEQIVRSGGGGSWSCRNTQNLSAPKCDNSECNRNVKR
jgi:hypothetical protein